MSGRNNGSRRKGYSHVYPRQARGYRTKRVFSPSTNHSVSNIFQSFKSESDVLSKRRTREQWEMNQVEASFGNQTSVHSQTPRIEPVFENSTTLPVTPDRQQHFNSKLFVQRNTGILIPSPSTQERVAIITQASDSEMEMETEEDKIDTSHEKRRDFSPTHGFMSPNQRKKCRTDQYIFPLAPSGGNASASDLATNVKKVETYWWKSQKPKYTIRGDSNAIKSCTCHVCNNSTYSHSSQSRNQNQTLNDNGQKQKNSLLSYFHRHPNQIKSPSCHKKPGPSSNKSTLKLPEAGIRLESCAYCDRPACHSCMRLCEGGCNLKFCTFCSTINYDGPTERILCFKCHEDDGYLSDCKMDDII